MIVMVGIIAVAIYSKKTSKQIFSYSVVWVLTGSMEPNIPAKSYILTKKIEAKDVSVGDVITFKSRDPELEGASNTHRVVAIVGNNEKFITKGDNNPSEDYYEVYAEDVIAKYERGLPILTFFGRLYSSTAGFIATISFILIGFTVAVIIIISKHRKQLKEDEIDKLVKEEVLRLEKEGLNESLDRLNEDKK